MRGFAGCPHYASVSMRVKDSPELRGPSKAAVPTLRSLLLEEQASRLARAVARYIKRQGGQYVRDCAGQVRVIVHNCCIELNLQQNNHALAKLLLAAAGVGSLSTAARLAIQRLQVHANDHASRVAVTQFATLRHDRLYVPIADGSLVCASPEGLAVVRNGDNQDRVWVERTGAPFVLRTTDPGPGLTAFERLLVQTQACVHPSMQWLVAMHAAFLPFVRDQLLARAILVLRGPSQSGKTSGAQRFTRFLGLGEVKGDYSIPAFANIPDPGLLVMDNREQADCTRDFTNFCLFLSTGAERARANPEGNLRVSSSRPIGVITSIEGMTRDEFRRRCVEVTYNVTGGRLPRSEIERAILERRHEIGAAILHVFVRYLQTRGQNASPDPMPDFQEYFSALCDLLRAYADVAAKGEDWAQAVIADWARITSVTEDDEDELELAILEARARGQFPTAIAGYAWRGALGTLYITDLPTLLTTLRRLNPTAGLPLSGNGLLRRLKSTRFKHVRIVESATIPTAGIAPGMMLPHIGVWFPSSHEQPRGRQTTGRCPEPPPIPQSLQRIGPAEACDHSYLDGDDCYYLWRYETGMRNRRSITCPENMFIISLKFSPLCRVREPLRWSRKQASIEHAGRALSETVPADWRQGYTWVPIPPSRLLDEPGYDPRLVDIIRSITPPPADVRPLLRQTQSVPSLRKGFPPAARARMMAVDECFSTPAPERIILFDDLIASGSHFKAAQQVLLERFPQACVFGVFLSRRVPAREAAAVATCTR